MGTLHLDEPTAVTTADAERLAGRYREASHERTAVVEARVSDAVGALDDIADPAEGAATGITEVADANDDRAATIEGITDTVEEVRRRGEEAEAAVDDIVEATERQAAVVDDPHGQVEDLTTG